MITYRQPFAGDYPISQKYGEVIPSVTKNGKPHTGIDYACPVNTPILASADGIVMKAGWDSTGYGNLVIILHAAQCSTLYAHLSECAVYDNQKVRQGDVIGWSGYTGNVVPPGITGSHLHFEARRRWNDWTSHFDPMDLPLMSFADPAPAGNPVPLKDADQLGTAIIVTAPAGAKRYNDDWTLPNPIGYPEGTKLIRTGRTKTRPGYPYTYVEVYEKPQTYWVAVSDEDTQILDDDE